MLSASYQDYTDQNIYTNKYANSQTTSGTLNYNITFLKEATSLGASILIADTKQSTNSTSLRGITFNGSKSFFENKLSAGLSIGYTQTSISITNSKTNTFTESINASYRLSSQGTLSFSMYATENSTAPPIGCSVYRDTRNIDLYAKLLVLIVTLSAPEQFFLTRFYIGISCHRK